MPCSDIYYKEAGWLDRLAQGLQLRVGMDIFECPGYIPTTKRGLGIYIKDTNTLLPFGRDCEIDCNEPPMVGDDPDSVTPLILDLDGDGVETGGTAYFDFNGDGFAELSHWVGEDDALLAIDRNGNGVIDTGAELFGEHTPTANGGFSADGFAALNELDSNNDGVVNSADSKWSELVLLRWVDSDGDGTLDSMAHVSLESAGITSVDTSSASSEYIDDQGNEHRLVGSYTRSDGTTAAMHDVWLQTNQYETVYNDAAVPEHSESIAGMPELFGRGRMYDLRDAMALDAAGRLEASYYGRGRTETRTLEQLVDAFRLEANDEVRNWLVEKILLRWTGAEDVLASDYWDSARPLSHIQPHKIAVVEAIRGSQWREGDAYRNPAKSTAQEFKNYYDQSLDSVWASLMAQTHLSTLYASISSSVNSETNEYNLDLSGVVQHLTGDSEHQFRGFVKSLLSFVDSDFLLNEVKEFAPSIAGQFEYYIADMEGRLIRGGWNNYKLEGLDGRADHFDADVGGNNGLHGGTGADVYWLGRGTGHDRIHEVGGVSDGDVVRLEAGLSASDVRLARDTANLYVKLLDGGGRVTDVYTVVDYYTNEERRIARVELSDGTLVFGVEDFDQVRIRGGRGLDGRADHFDADVGGNDNLHGGTGADVYWLGRGTGHDRIHEVGGVSDGDVIRLETGLSVSDVRLGRDRNTLYVELIDELGRVTDVYAVVDYYTNKERRIARVELSDGTLIFDVEDFDQVLIRGGKDGYKLEGLDGRADHFDADVGGNNGLHGGTGADVYWLGRGTGHDRIHEVGGVSDGDVIRLEAGLSASDVRLGRDTANLYVKLLDDSGRVTDVYTVVDYYTNEERRIARVELSDGTLVFGVEDFDQVRIRGGRGLDGRADHFDADVGGNDNLHGGTGADVYWLGRGTGHDRIHEVGGVSDGDVIRLEAGLSVSDVRLGRDRNTLYVELIDELGRVTDVYAVVDYYTNKERQIARVELSDGTLIFDVEDFDQVLIRGGKDGYKLEGLDGRADHFDADVGGNNGLHGGTGADVYWLGRGTGHDRIYEVGGVSDGDVIRLEAGLSASDVRLGRDTANLYVELLTDSGRATDVYTVVDYYTNEERRIPRVELSDGTLVFGVEDFDQVHIRGDGGDNDNLHGGTGADVYWLGRGTGHDRIHEVGGVSDGDVIRLEAGLSASDVRLGRDRANLYVELLDDSGRATDSYTVVDYYTNEERRIPRVELSDATLVFGVEDFDQARIRSGRSDGSVSGLDGRADHLDADAGGNHRLHGGTGADVYWLGRGTGRDKIYEVVGVSDGDVIRLESGLSASDVRLGRDTANLYVELVDEGGVVTDSYTVVDYYTNEERRIPRVELSDATLVFGVEDFDQARIRSGRSDGSVSGLDGRADHIDADAGGNHRLHGGTGADVYWLGRGTGRDKIYEVGGVSDGDVIRLESGLSASDVRLGRDTANLYVELVDEGGVVTDSYTVVDYYTNEERRIPRVELFDETLVFGVEDFDQARIRSGRSDGSVSGLDGRADHIDADAGGNHRLHGGTGADVYWLGRGTGRDKIYEVVGVSDGDVIRLESGLSASDVRLGRDTANLYVELVDEGGVVTDSYTVIGYYTNEERRIPRVELSDGTLVFGVEDFDQARIRSGRSDGSVSGLDGRADHIDADAGGNHRLHGGTGADVYWLGRGTGRDKIYEVVGVSDGDVIRLEAGLSASDVRLGRDTANLYVELVDEDAVVTDSYTVVGYYTNEERRIPRVELSDGTLVFGVEDFDQARIRSGKSDGSVSGLDGRADHLDADAGGNHRLHGGTGADVYWLGRGTGRDEIYEVGGVSDGDVIRLEAGLSASDVRLGRDTANLYVKLVNEGGVVTDSYAVVDYYTNDGRRIARVELSDETLVFGIADFDQVRIRSGRSDGSVYGLDGRADHIDADLGRNDYLYGGTGNDVYWLGRWTDRDTVIDSGGAADRISIESDYGIEDIEIVDQNGDLVVRLRDNEGSLAVDDHFTDADKRVEHIDAGGRTLDTSRVRDYMSALDDFHNDEVESEYSTMQSLVDDFWV